MEEPTRFRCGGVIWQTLQSTGPSRCLACRRLIPTWQPFFQAEVAVVACSIECARELFLYAKPVIDRQARVKVNRFRPGGA